MKENLRDIEDRELRNLVRWERLMASFRDGGLVKSREAQETRVAAAEKRLVQIKVLEAVAAKASYKEMRNAQMAKIAAGHRAAAAERQAIREAVDEVLALEEVIPAEDIDDILAEFSAALGIEMPTAADRPDICHRGPKSMADLKRELGPSLATFLAHPVQAVQSAVEDHQKADELIADVRRTALLQGMVDDTTSDDFSDAAAVRKAAEAKLTAFISDLIKRVHFPLMTDVHCPVPERGHVPPAQELTLTSNEPAASFHEWAQQNIDILDDESLAWIEKYAPSEPADAHDDEVLASAAKVVIHPFDAGKTLEQLGWSPPPYEPPKPPDTIASWEEAVRRMESYGKMSREEAISRMAS